MTLRSLPPMTSSEDGVYEIYALCYARALQRRVHDNFMRRDMHDGPMPVDFNLWIVRNAQRMVLVDTGFGARAAAARGRTLDVDPLEALERIGFPAEMIEDVVITHMHYDHAGNIGRFHKARFHLQESEGGYATGRCMCEPHLRAPYDVEDAVALVRHTYAERVVFHQGDAAPWPGISLHLLPGHTEGMQAVRVITPRGPVVLASDASHYYANLLRRAPFPGSTNTISTLRSYQRLLELAGGAERVIPGHDPKVRRLYPCYDVGGLALTALHEAPQGFDSEQLVRLDDFLQE